MLTNEEPPAKFDEKATAVKAFGTFLKGTVADKAHSGSARQPFEEESSDYYPVALTLESMRPGDDLRRPVRARAHDREAPPADARSAAACCSRSTDSPTAPWRESDTGAATSSTRRSASSADLDSSGFGPSCAAPASSFASTTRRSEEHPDYGDVSRDAAKLDLEGFYDKMEDVLSPQPLDPQRAMLETISALEEQVRTRVKSVDNGRKWLDDGEGARVDARGPGDLRDERRLGGLLHAVARSAHPHRDRRRAGLPGARRPAARALRDARRPHRRRRWRASSSASSTRELESRSVEYTRTDGTAVQADARRGPRRAATALEMAYNPNDCVESRWGAPAGSAELATCRAHAPAEQRSRMESYRAWFHERRRPPRKYVPCSD